MPGRRMDNDAGRLVDDHEIVIVVDDLERQRLGFWRRRCGRRNLDLHFESRGGQMAGLGAAA